MAATVSELVSRRPHPRLRPYVQEYTGYRLAGFAPGVHAGLPSRSLTLIVAFDEPLDVTPAEPPGGGPAARDRFWGVLGGLHARPATVHHEGRQHGVQLAVTPRGAPALFGLPAGALAHDLAHLDDLRPAFGRELVERLSSARSWPARWASLDELLLRELQPDHDDLPPQLEQAWAALTTSYGAVPIADLATGIGWSRRHFSERFRTTFGLTPKVMARVLRFERAQQVLRLPTRPSLASVAALCGYADQAHLTREWQELAGSSPTTWLADETLPFVQDVDGPLPS